MGNPGSIEKVMVFGILVIILGILAIAVYGSRNVTAGADGQLAVAPGVQNQLPIKGASGGELRGSDDAEPGSDPSANSVNVLIVDPSDLENVPAIDDDKRFDDNTRNRPAKESAPNGESVAVAPDVTDDDAKRATKLPDTYKVQKDDTLEGIAKRLYGDRKYVEDLRAANGGLNPTKMFVGQEIRLPPISIAKPDVVKAPQKPESSAKALVPPPDDGAGLAKEPKKATPTDKTYTIQQGDNLIKISRKFYGDALKVKSILALNKNVITDANNLPAGQSIKLP